MLSRIKLRLFLSILLASAFAIPLKSQVLPGAVQTEKYFKILHGKKIGIVANASSLVGGVNIVDTLFHSGIDIKVVFSPEHGFKLKEEAGQLSNDYTDPNLSLIHI